MTATWLVLLRQRNGHPWEGAAPRIVQAQDADAAVAAAFAPPPSTLEVHDAWVHQLADPYFPYSIELNVPRPRWKPAVAARPEDARRDGA